MEEMLLELIPKFLGFIGDLIPDFSIPSLDFFWDILTVVAYILPMKTIAEIIGLVLLFCWVKIVLVFVRLVVEVVGIFT